MWFARARLIWTRRRGASVVEYLIAMMLLALVVVGINRLYGETLYQKYAMGDERIRTMERSPEELNASTAQETLITAESTSQGGHQGGGARVTQIKNVDPSGESFSASNSSLSEQDQKRVMAEHRALKRRAARRRARGG